MTIFAWMYTDSHGTIRGPNTTFRLTDPKSESATGQPPNSAHLWSVPEPVAVVGVGGTSAWNCWPVESYRGQTGVFKELGLPPQANRVQYRIMFCDSAIWPGVNVGGVPRLKVNRYCSSAAW